MADEPEVDDADEYVERVLTGAEIAAERLIAWVRIIAAVGIGITYFATIETLVWLGLIAPLPMPPPAATGIGSVLRGLMIMFTLFGSGLLALYFARRGRWCGWMSYAFAALDAAMLIFAIMRPLIRFDLPGFFAPAATAAFAVPLALALGSLRPKPRVQLTFVGLFAGGMIVTLALWGYPLASPTTVDAAQLAPLFTMQSNVGRLLMLTAAGLTIALGVMRSRALLSRSIEESQHRKALTRFLPSEIAPLISGNRFDALRRGERRMVTIMFVDMRNSTARAELMDEVRLSVFISSFRRRVMRATSAHAGVVDKFIGDGALVLFGLRDDTDGAAEALSAAADILRLIERWNDKRNFNPPLRIGIGIHTGQAYVGVIGSEDRLEFTVLGDAVNVASRLEEQTKEAHVPLLVSQDTLQAAGTPQGWASLGHSQLRGRTEELTYYTRACDLAARPALPAKPTLPVIPGLRVAE